MPNPYIDDDLQALADHARRFAQGAWRPASRRATRAACSTAR
jgi:hypothetical protein